MRKITVLGHRNASGAFQLSTMATTNGLPATENTPNTVYQVLRAINIRSLILIWDEGCWDEREWE